MNGLLAQPESATVSIFADTERHALPSRVAMPDTVAAPDHAVMELQHGR